MPVVSIDYPAIREAALLSEARRLSFWDGLIVVAAKRCGAKRLYTEDLNHGQVIEGVEIVDPFR
jgi:predicted nucleic acid-binding protein